jgi:quinol monooxygenase YgiN
MNKKLFYTLAVLILCAVLAFLGWKYWPYWPLKDKPVYVIETFIANPGKSEELKQELLKLVPVSHKQEGCFFYDLYQSRKDPNRIIIVMGWKSKSAYYNHNKSQAVQNFEKKFNQVLYQQVTEDLYDKVNKNAAPTNDRPKADVPGPAKDLPSQALKP